MSLHNLILCDGCGREKIGKHRMLTVMLDELVSQGWCCDGCTNSIPVATGTDWCPDCVAKGRYKHPIGEKVRS